MLIYGLVLVYGLKINAHIWAISGTEDSPLHRNLLEAPKVASLPRSVLLTSREFLYPRARSAHPFARFSFRGFCPRGSRALQISGRRTLPPSRMPFGQP